MKKLYTTVLLLILGASAGWSQNIGINETGNAPDASAGLEVDFTDKGVLIPRVALVQTTNTAPITAPATALLVYNTATANDVTPGFYYWDGTEWTRIGAGADDEDWEVNGNDVYTGHGGAFPSGNVGIGTTNPLDLLHVNGILRLPGSEGNDYQIRPGQNLSTGVVVRALTNPPNDDAIFGVESSGGATRFGVTQGNGAWTRDGYWIGNYDNGGLTQDVGMQRVGNDLTLETNNTERVRVTNNGNVGVATNTPGARLDVDHDGEDIAVRGEGKFGPTNGYLGVQGNTNFDGVNTLDNNGDEVGVLGISTGSSENDNYGVYGHSNGWGGRFEYENGNNYVELGGDTYAIRIVDGSEANDRVLTSDGNGNGTWQDISTFYDDEDWEVDGNDVYTGHGGAYPSGNVGIGTINPTEQLHVQGGVRSETGLTVGDSPNYGEHLIMAGSDGPASVKIGHTGGFNEVESGRLSFDENADNYLNIGNYCGFEFRHNGDENKLFLSSACTAENTRMTFERNGDIGIATENPTGELSVNGTANKPGGGNWAVFSDKRLKEDVKPYQEGLEFIKKVNPVNFRYNNRFHEIWGQNEKIKNKVYQGVIAQDLIKIAPDMVNEVNIHEEYINDDDKSKSASNESFYEVDPSKFTFALINAVKDQQEIIENQRSLLDDLQSTSSELKEQNAKQQALIEELSKRLEKLESEE